MRIDWTASVPLARDQLYDRCVSIQVTAIEDSAEASETLAVQS